jgi:hypothetical protein
MAAKEPKISKQAAGITRDITFTISETTEIIRKLGNATNQSVTMAVQKVGLLTICGIKKHKGKITCSVQLQWHLFICNCARLNK